MEPADFLEYTDVNLIPSRDFDAVDPETALPVWQREIADSTYMIFEEITAAEAGTVSGLPDPAAPVFRLEIPNLIDNGDFEADPAGTGWSTSGGATLTWVPNTDPKAIAGRSLYFSHSSNTLDYLEMNLSALTPDALYSIRFDLGLTIKMETMLFQYDNGTSNPVKWSPALSEYSITDIIAFPVANNSSIPAFSSAAGGSFLIGWPNNNSGQQGYFDNLRITRIDQSNMIYAEIPYQETGRPALLSGGTYTFSVYVKREDPSQVTPVRVNHYHAEGLTMGINDTTGLLSGISVDINGVTDSQWTEVSVSYNQTQRVQIYLPDDPTDPVIQLSLVPSKWCENGQNTAGSILISSPSLIWSPEL